MRFEPPDFLDPDAGKKKEVPLFRVEVSYRPVMLYLFMCGVFICAYGIAEQKIAMNDPFAPILRVFMGGWTVSLLLFFLAVLSYLYNRIEVTSRRIYGRLLSVRSHRLSIPLTGILSVKVSQYFFAGPLHYGRLTLRINRKRIFIPWVREPGDVKAALDRAILQAKADAGSSPIL